jgi:hypothetical protein
VAQASRPPGRKGKEGKFTHFIFYKHIFNTIFKMNFETKANKTKTTPHNKTNATA